MGFHFLTNRCLRRQAGDTGQTLVVVSSGHIDWIVRADMRDAIMGSHAPDWLALNGCDKACLVETGHQRTVWHICSTDTDLFAKVSHVSGLRRRVKNMLLGTPGEREWRVAIAAAVRDVPLPEFVALGVAKGHTTESVLLTTAIPNATTLTAAWQKSMDCTADTAGRRRGALLIQEVASLLRQAHEAGFSHHDGHPNNILVSRPEEGPARRAFYVDTLGARLTRGSVDTARVALSFAQLDQHFHRVASQTDRLRLLRAYSACGKATRNGAAARQWLRRLVPLIGQQRKRIAASLARLRDRRLSTDNKYFARLRLANGWRATVALRLERRHVFPEAHVPDRTTEEWRKILDMALSAVRGTDKRITSLACNEVEFEYCDLRGFTRSLAATLRSSTHRCSFERCHQLRHRDVHCELMLGYAEHRSRGLVDGSVLMRPRAPNLAPDAPMPGRHDHASAGDQRGDEPCPHESR